MQGKRIKRKGREIDLCNAVPLALSVRARQTIVPSWSSSSFSLSLSHFESIVISIVSTGFANETLYYHYTYTILDRSVCRYIQRERVLIMHQSSMMISAYACTLMGIVLHFDPYSDAESDCSCVNSNELHILLHFVVLLLRSLMKDFGYSSYSDMYDMRTILDQFFHQSITKIL